MVARLYLPSTKNPHSSVGNSLIPHNPDERGHFRLGPCDQFCNVRIWCEVWSGIGKGGDDRRALGDDVSRVLVDHEIDITVGGA
jgi:hypothetical protein